MTSPPAVRIRPTVSWPRRVRANEQYLMTVDVDLSADVAWPYDREEYVIGCVVDGAPWCRVEPLDAGLLVLHRFGGTYGPARFAVRVDWDEPTTPLRLTLLTAAGLPFYSTTLPVEREEIAPLPGKKIKRRR